MYQNNTFNNKCSDADETGAYFFQSIGEDNASYIRSYTVRWTWNSAETNVVLIYLSNLSGLHDVGIEETDGYGLTKKSRQCLSRIRAKNFVWRTTEGDMRNDLSEIIEGRVLKRKRIPSWERAVSPQIFETQAASKTI